MKKNLLNYDLQLFAEDEEVAGENEVETTAESQEEEESEVESDETSVNEGVAEPAPQSDEDNARYAAIRRKAEEDARRRYDAEIGAMNQKIAAICQGVTHPVTGQPLRTVSEYIDALSEQQRIAREKELQSKGIDPAMIDQMIAQNPVVQQAQQVIEKSRMTEAENLLLDDISEIGKYDPNIKSPQDIRNIPRIDEMCAYCAKTGVRLADAYKIFNFDTAKQSATSAGRQQAINEMRGKQHLPSQTQNLTTDEEFVDVPAEIMNSWKAEGKTEKQIRDLYKKVASKLHIS